MNLTGSPSAKAPWLDSDAYHAAADGQPEPPLPADPWATSADEDQSGPVQVATPGRPAPLQVGPAGRARDRDGVVRVGSAGAAGAVTEDVVGRDAGVVVGEVAVGLPDAAAEVGVRVAVDGVGRGHGAPPGASTAIPAKSASHDVAQVHKGDRRTRQALTPTERRLRNARYSKRYRLARNRGIDHRQDATAITAHIAALRDMHVSVTAIAAACTPPVPPSTVSRLARGEHAKASRKTADAILAVTLADTYTAATRVGCHVPAIGATRRIRALQRLGWTKASITIAIRALGVVSTVDGILECEAAISWRLYAAVRDVYADLSTRPGPSHVGAARAANAGHPLPACWDDDEIDDPRCGPRLPGDDALGFDDAYEMIRDGRTITEAATACGLDPESIVTTARRRARRSGTIDDRIRHRRIVLARQEEYELRRELGETGS